MWIFEQYRISIQVVRKSGYSDIILVRQTVLEYGKLLLSAKAIEFELDGGFYEALDLRTAKTLLEFQFLRVCYENNYKCLV
ncbi:unnamed protein product [Parnassius apollo]|uniref:(apollo) hypothetical protein n=1 Tax=Parnassius apollo TaxID=110799 RepID=A0A8S3Y0K3_PARAO|nr:unnamed protein product [Parnassius apollo]